MSIKEIIGLISIALGMFALFIGVSVHMNARFDKIGRVYSASLDEHGCSPSNSACKEKVRCAERGGFAIYGPGGGYRGCDLPNE